MRFCLLHEQQKPKGDESDEETPVAEFEFAEPESSEDTDDIEETDDPASVIIPGTMYERRSLSSIKMELSTLFDAALFVSMRAVVVVELVSSKTVEDDEPDAATDTTAGVDVV